MIVVARSAASMICQRSFQKLRSGAFEGSAPVSSKKPVFGAAIAFGLIPPPDEKSQQ